MNLLIDCHSFDSNFSQGVTTYIQGIYSILPKIAPDINFYFAANNIEKLINIFGSEPNISYIPLNSKSKIDRLLLLWPRLIKEYKIDVAHFQYISPLIKNCKTIVTTHDILFLDYPQFFPTSYKLSKSYFFKRSAVNADLLCTVSDYSRERIAHHYNLDSKCILLTPNAVSNDFFCKINEIKTNSFDKYLLYVSRIEPRKNHIALINAFVRLKLYNEGYKLVFIGKETVPTPKLYELLNSLPIIQKREIILLPQVSYKELIHYYKNASLFLYPSLAEGFGIPPIEAAVAGIPVICNNATAMSDFTFLGDNLIDFNDEDLLDRRIIKILEKTPENLKSIRDEVNLIYNWKTISNNLYNEIKKRFYE